MGEAAFRELEPYQSCPLCDEKAMEPHAVASCAGHRLYKPVLSPEMRWVRCQSCGHVFRDGYFTPEACAVVFADTHESQRVGHNLERQRLISASMIEKVARYRAEGAWLDVGFGNGSLLMTAQEFGFEPVGLDLRADNVEALRGLEIEAHCCGIEGLDGAGRFDVVSMADVLEHVPYPRDVLRKAWELLTPGGVLFCSMPNMDAPVWQVMDALNANPYWGEIEHYHNFGRARLYALLEECGFQPVSYGVSERYRACMEVISIKAG